MASELILAASLSQDKAEGNHLPLLIVKSSSGVVVAKTVVCQPAVDIFPQCRSFCLTFCHAFSKERHLFFQAFVKTAVLICSPLRLQRKSNVVLLYHLVGDLQEIIGPSYPKISGSLIENFFYCNRVQSCVQGSMEHMAEFSFSLASQKNRQDTEHPLLFCKSAFFRNFSLGKI